MFINLTQTHCINQDSLQVDTHDEQQSMHDPSYDTEDPDILVLLSKRIL